MRRPRRHGHRALLAGCLSLGLIPACLQDFDQFAPGGPADAASEAAQLLPEASTLPPSDAAEASVPDSGTDAADARTADARSDR